jgi:peptidoglycan/LPS O-acetylase OafA/YrhL
MPSDRARTTVPATASSHSAFGPDKYRADIDGLRGIAVLAVVAYHAFPRVVRGGFVGVDVFFVISGFLISSILYSRHLQGRFSFVDFYDRRIRRIFPALIVMMLAVLAFGWFGLLAQEYRQVGKHVASGAGFVLNFVFLGEAGYFDASGEVKPLLHLWSLAIEEQFYILWPFLLATVWRWRRGLLWLTALVAVLSFVGNLLAVRVSPSAGFYLPFTRFWELMMGSLLAYFSLQWPGAAPRYPNLKSCLGLSLLAASIVALDRSAPFPGWRALVPTVGVALVIEAGPNAFLNQRLLADRGLVWFGLISYPLYLWHWPLFSFAHIIGGAPPETDVKLILVVVAVFLAWLTYAFVERRLRYRARSALTSVLLLATMACVGAAGGLVFATQGFANRSSMQGPTVTAGDLEHDEFHAYMQGHFHPCTPPQILRQSLSWEGLRRCYQSQPGPTKDIAIVGDSHAEHLFIGIAEALPDTNVVEYIQGSLPVLGDERYRSIFDVVRRDPSIRQVLLTAHWQMKAPDAGPLLERALTATVRMLVEAGKRVYLVEDVPAFDFLPRVCKSSGRFGQGYRCTQERSVRFPGHEPVRQVLERVAATGGQVEVIQVVDDLCAADRCFMARDGNLLYRDSHHLGILGSRYVGGRIVAQHPDLGR